jgi:integrase/recombinase XerD
MSRRSTREDQPRVDSATLQPPLFDVTERGEVLPEPGLVPPLDTRSKLPDARYWYISQLREAGRPRNTLASYAYDLQIFEQIVGLKRIGEVTQRDIADFLGDAQTRTTRKRRLTSVSGFFKWLLNQAEVIQDDPTASFYPDHIPLKTPRTLSAEEQIAFLETADGDSTRSALMSLLMLRVGVSRGELLGLRRSHLDFSEPETPWVYIFYESPRRQAYERRLAAPPELRGRFEAFDREYAPQDQLFELLPQSVNKVVERIAHAAGIEKRVSPQTLRDTFATNLAREGATEQELLHVLGLADDPRNRMSVRRYLDLAGGRLPTLADVEHAEPGN